jgi:hypothetical protein
LLVPRPAVAETSLPATHPEKPDPENGYWVLVALGDGNFKWAWVTHEVPPPTTAAPK